MIRLTLDELEARRLDVETAVDRTDAPIDRWCSGPDWVLSVHAGFAPEVEPLILASPDGTGFALLARYPTDDGGTAIAGLEPLWGFASPLVGPDLATMATGVAEHLAEVTDWDVLILPGMPSPEASAVGPLRVLEAVSQLGLARLTPVITRQVADLGDGAGAWLDRRSARFRRNLRRAIRAAEGAGLRFVDAADDPDPFERVMATERRSWKGREGSGITSAQMAATYETMIGRLAASGRLRLWFARHDGRDVGYILGGVRAGVYRGLQLSYTTDAEELSVGHLLQHHQISALDAEGGVHTYDLGMDFEYKRRWADEAIPMSCVVVERSPDHGPGKLRS